MKTKTTRPSGWLNLAILIMTLLFGQNVSAAKITEATLHDYSIKAGRALQNSEDAIALFDKDVAKIVKELGDLLIAIDPPSATIYSGNVVLQYNQDILEFDKIGWFAEFGLDSGLKGPPIFDDGGLLFDPGEGEYHMQDKNPSLGVSVDDSIAGVLDIAFDWGDNPISIDSTDPFNFLGILFKSKSEQSLLIDVTERGAGDIGLVEGAQLLFCSVAGSDEIVGCGDEPAGDIKLTLIPEPSILFLFSLGVAGIAATRNKGFKKGEQI